MFAVYAFMGAWDGLVRRHIRLRPGLQTKSLLIQGPLAVIVGIFCVLLLVFLYRLASIGMPALTRGCASSLCLFERNVVLPFTTLPSLLVLALVAALFIPWLRGMFDFDGPFRTLMLAPGVWYREREAFTLARTALDLEGKAPVPANVILDLADNLLLNFHGVSPTMPAPNSTTPPPTRDMVVRAFTSSSLVRKRRGATKVAQRVIIAAMAPYIIDKLEAAERRWPWRRRFLEMFP